MASLRLDALHTLSLGPIDLTIGSGELVFISGPSGSGKSLLLRAIADLDPHLGEVWLDTQARSAMAPSHWRRRVGLLPAESFWWGDSVGEHFPSPEAQENPDATHHGFLTALGFEFDVMDWSVARLSTGERQRLALARMLAQQPDALLLDEATANLDPTNRERVERVVETYRSEWSAAVLWVSHDPDQRSRLADQGAGHQLGIRDGRLETQS